MISNLSTLWEILKEKQKLLNFFSINSFLIKFLCKKCQRKNEANKRGHIES